MINKIQYKITVFEENYKEGNISLWIAYAFLAFKKKKKNLYWRQNSKIKKFTWVK